MTMFTFFSLLRVMERIIGSENPDIRHIESIVDIIRNFADGLAPCQGGEPVLPVSCKQRIFPLTGTCGSDADEHVQGQGFCQRDR